MSRRRQNEAKVMFACLRLREDPTIGRSTVPLIKKVTSLFDWTVRRCLRTLVDMGYVDADPRSTAEVGRDCYFVDKRKHITRSSTAWLVEQFICWHRDRRSITIEAFVNALDIPEEHRALRNDEEVRGRIRLLLERRYLEEDEFTVIRVGRKTAEQRLYIELLAKDTKLEELAGYRFKSVYVGEVELIPRG